MSRKDRQANLQMNQQTNETNLQMNRETNQANQMINQANIDYSREAWANEVAYNWEMWNKTNEYNDPSAQMQRLKNAGLNPYTMMDGGDAGTASAGSAPSHAQPQQLPMQAGKVDPYYVPLSNTAQDVQNVISAVGQMADVQLKRQQEIGMGIQNQYMAQKQAAEVAKILADTGNTKLRNQAQRMANQITGESMNAQIEAAKRQPALMDAQISQLQSQVAFNDANKELALQRAKQMPYELWIQAMDVISQIDLRDKQGKFLSADAAESRIRTALYQIEKDNKIHYTPQQMEILTRYSMVNAQNQAAYYYQSARGMRLGNDAIENVPEWLRQGGIGDRSVDLAGSVVGSIGSGLFGYGVGKGLFNMLKKRPKIGFR